MIRRTLSGALVEGAQQLGAGDCIGWHTIRQELTAWNPDHPTHTLCWNDGESNKIVVMDQSSVHVWLQAMAEAMNLNAEDVSNAYPHFIAIKLVAKT